MLKGGQIWDRKINGDQHQIGLVVDTDKDGVTRDGTNDKFYYVYVLDGLNSGEYVHWSHHLSYQRLREGKLVQLA